MRPRPVRRVHDPARRTACERVPSAGRLARRRGDRHRRGPRRQRLAPRAAGCVRRARRVPVRLLHAGTAVLGGRHARRGRGGLAQLRVARRDPRVGRQPGRDPRADERQHLPLRCVSEHRRRDRRGGALKPFRYERARDEAGAVALLAATPGARFLGGGTNLVDLMRLGVETPDVLVDVSRLPLDRVEPLPGGGLRVGAAVRNGDLAADPAVRERYPALAQALLSGASGQVRNQASVAGNLLRRTRCGYFQDVPKPCNKRAPGSGCPARDGEHRNLAILGASPACVATHPSDMAVALAALDALVLVEGRDGARTIPLRELHRLPGDEPQRDTVLEPGDLITAVDVPALAFAVRSSYRKVRDRASFSFAVVSAAAAVDLDEGG